MFIQKSLIEEQDMSIRTVFLKNVKATFYYGENDFYDVVLEINSNKFYLSVQQVNEEIDNLKIICTKGFVELSNRLVVLLKQLLNHLFLRLDLDLLYS